MSDSLWPHGLQPNRLVCPWNSPGKKPGVSCHSLLQLTQGLNLGLPHGRQNLYWLSHQGSSFIYIYIYIKELGFEAQFIYLFMFWPCCMAYRTLLPWPGTGPGTPAVEIQRANHWTTGIPPTIFLTSLQALIGSSNLTCPDSFDLHCHHFKSVPPIVFLV